MIKGHSTSAETPWYAETPYGAAIAHDLEVEIRDLVRLRSAGDGQTLHSTNVKSTSALLKSYSTLKRHIFFLNTFWSDNSIQQGGGSWRRTFG